MQSDHGRSADDAPLIGIIAALTDYAAMAAVLAGDCRTTMLDERSAIAAIRDGRIDLLLLSPRSDWWAEIGGVADLQVEAVRGHVTTLALVPRGDAAALAHAFDSGVADCAGYPLDAAEVAVRVRALLRRKHIADRLRADAAEVRRLAVTCPVTGLWNRHHLDTDLAAKIGAATAGAVPLSLMMIDIDRFKPINDRHGHAIGDKVLRAVAMRLGAGIRARDTLARFGGDELALVMPETGLETACLVAERLRALVADGTTEVPFTVTISIGVAELRYDESATELLTRADAALYAAKVDGRNRVAAAAASS